MEVRVTAGVQLGEGVTAGVRPWGGVAGHRGNAISLEAPHRAGGDGSPWGAISRVGAGHRRGATCGGRGDPGGAGHRRRALERSRPAILGERIFRTVPRGPEGTEGAGREPANGSFSSSAVSKVDHAALTPHASREAPCEVVPADVG